MTTEQIEQLIEQCKRVADTLCKPVVTATQWRTWHDCNRSYTTMPDERLRQMRMEIAQLRENISRRAVIQHKQLTEIDRLQLQSNQQRASLARYRAEHVELQRRLAQSHITNYRGRVSELEAELRDARSRLDCVRDERTRELEDLKQKLRVEQQRVWAIEVKAAHYEKKYYQMMDRNERY